jgi:hypothetical protein
MSEHFAEIIGRDGRRRRAKKGEILADGERFSLPMTFMDAQMRDELAAKYRSDNAVRIVDAAGQPAGHRPGFLFDANNALGESAAEVAYRERCAQLDAKTRKRRRPDDDEDDDEAGAARREPVSWEERQRVARKAAAATLGLDAQPLTPDEARAAVEAAREARDERLRNAWRSRHA